MQYILTEAEYKALKIPDGRYEALVDIIINIGRDKCDDSNKRRLINMLAKDLKSDIQTGNTKATLDAWTNRRQISDKIVPKMVKKLFIAISDEVVKKTVYPNRCVQIITANNRDEAKEIAINDYADKNSLFLVSLHTDKMNDATSKVIFSSRPTNDDIQYEKENKSDHIVFKCTGCGQHECVCTAGDNQ